MNGSGDITITSTTTMDGTCTLLGSSTGTSEYVVTLSGTSVTVLASTHGLGVNVSVASCYDAGGHLFDPGAVNINGSGDVTISSTSSMTGRCILQ